MTETFTGVTLIGRGTSLLPVQDGDLALASAPDKEGRFASIRMSRDGTIRVNERIITTDQELVSSFPSALRKLTGEWLSSDAASHP
jgi:hypothetical protein